jgi:hypothetical protein
MRICVKGRFFTLVILGFAVRRRPGIHNPGPRLWIPGSRFRAPRNDGRWNQNDEGAKMRPFCCEYPRKLMQFFPKNDPPPQTDSERAAA